MGCCLGTTKRSKTPNPDPDHANGSNHHQFHAISLAAEPKPIHIEKTQVRASPPQPPPIVEEESVKEVLSETPIAKPQSPKKAQEKNTHLPPKLQEHPKELSEASQSLVSESYGVSESFSLSTTTTTTTITEAKDDEATSKRKRELGPRVNGCSATVRRKRPYSGDLSGRRERGAKAPLRTSEPPVGKRNRTETRSFRGRESGQLRTMQRSTGSTGVRRDTASARSRSPATRTAGGVGRGGIGRSPSKVTGRAGGSSSSLGVENEGKKEEPNDRVSQQGSESLENPLVSLECFIFV